jgi:adenylate cyclase, class 2
MTAIETEIKFRVNDAADLEKRLEAAGFHQVTPRTFESNILFDTPDRKLRKEQQILRIRRYGDSWVLTYKRLPKGPDATRHHKHREETETRLQDGESLAHIFEQLGFIACFRYEKWRTEWQDSSGHCVLDETPIGLFAELEGSPEWIDHIAEKLGVRQEEFMTDSYGRLFESWRQATGSKAEHLTFDSIPSSIP